jgi:hypothetical protein
MLKNFALFLGAFPARGGLMDYFRTVGFSGPTPCGIFLVNALTGSREFLGVRRKPGFPLQSFVPLCGTKVFPLQSLARSVTRASALKILRK